MMGATEMKNESVSAFILLRLRIYAARKKLNEQKLNEQKLNDKNCPNKTEPTKTVRQQQQQQHKIKSNQTYYKSYS